MKALAGLAAAIITAILPATAFAVSSDLLFGQQHFYTVTMRGNGEAVVLARIVFTNTADTQQKTFSFQIPGSTAPSDLVGFQEQYAQACNGGLPTPTPLLKAPASSGAAIAQPAILPCLEYLTPGYPQPASEQGYNYKKLKFTASSGNNYKVTLPAPVPSQQSSSLLLSYSSMAYARSSLGAHVFNFQTIKVNQRTSSSIVALSVDPDQYLEGKSSVNYQPSAVDSGSLSTQANSAAPSASALNQVSDSVGTGGEIVKQATDLAPGDTLSVKGRYASSLLLLRLPGLLATLGFLALAVILALVFRKRIAKHLRIHHKRGPQPTVAALATNPAAHAAHPAVPFVSAGNVLAGLVSALGICGITWFVSWWSQKASNYSGGGVGNVPSPDPFSAGLVFMTAILAYVLFGLGPAVYLAATSRDWRRAVYTVAFEVLFLVAFVLIYALAIAPLLGSPSSVAPPIYNGAAQAQ
jgi:hypothetical protein